MSQEKSTYRSCWQALCPDPAFVRIEVYIPQAEHREDQVTQDWSCLQHLPALLNNMREEAEEVPLR